VVEAALLRVRALAGDEALDEAVASAARGEAGVAQLLRAELSAPMRELRPRLHELVDEFVSQLTDPVK
jgi:hypothetical protein